MNAAALFAAVFLACVVEAVEAATIVLAAGTARGWRSATMGILSALTLLAVIIAALGPALSLVPLRGLRLVVGGLLLVFGLQWLRKAILRASGHKALHDEDEIYRRELAAASQGGAQAGNRKFAVPDWYGFTLSFKGVLLEGLEVAFIALTFGSNARDLPLAALAAVCAVVVVAAVGAAVRGPLGRVPENTMKLIVGVMLTAFGTFWGAEGAGANWPGSDAALIVLVPAVAGFTLILIAILRLVPGPSPQAVHPAPAHGEYSAQPAAVAAGDSAPDHAAGRAHGAARRPPRARRGGAPEPVRGVAQSAADGVTWDLARDSVLDSGWGTDR